MLMVLVLSACAVAPPPPPVVTPNDALRDELLAMRDADQEVRRRWIKDRENPQINAEMNAVDARNIVRVREIIKTYGWPSKALVGEKASGAAWIIIQHSSPATIKEYLPLMRQAVARGDLHGGLYATSYDRVLLSEGKKQMYGSQFDTDNGRCQPKPIEDEANVDKRRKEVGLDTLAEYTAQLCALYQPKKQ